MGVRSELACMRAPVGAHLEAIRPGRRRLVRHVRAVRVRMGHLRMPRLPGAVARASR